MNKVISTNIGGLIFNLDENAYATLTQYLEQLKKHLSRIKSDDEILRDIELRIAELLGKKQSEYKQVISQQDVDEVISLLGDPKEYVDDSETSFKDEEESTSNHEHYSDDKSSSKKILFRDPDNGVAAGVCSGIATYFGMDVTIIRLIFIGLALFFGFAIPLYIILWIVVPKAITSGDKLKMKGEAITVENIKKEVHDASERVKNSKFTKDVSSKIEDVSKKVPALVNVIKKIIGVSLIIAAFFGILFFCFFIIGDYGYFVNNGEEIYSFKQFSDLFFQTNFQVTFGWTGFLLFFLMPILIISLIGLSLLFQLNRTWIKRINLSFFFLWLISIGFMIIIGLQVGRDFTNKAVNKSELVSTKIEKLIINVIDENRKTNNSTVNGFASDELFIKDKNTIQSNELEVEVKESDDSLVHIYIQRRAYGITNRKALNRANNIQAHIDYTNGKLNVSPSISYPFKDKYRGQEVTLLIFLPKNTSIECEGNKDLLDFDSSDNTNIHFNHGFLKIDYEED